MRAAIRLVCSILAVLLLLDIRRCSLPSADPQLTVVFDYVVVNEPFLSALNHMESHIYDLVTGASHTQKNCTKQYCLQVSKAADDPYAQSNHSRLSTGGVNLGAGAAAQAAVLNAAALAGPDVIRCELCQVDTIDLLSYSIKP